MIRAVAELMKVLEWKQSAILHQAGELFTDVRVVIKNMTGLQFKYLMSYGVQCTVVFIFHID